MEVANSILCWPIRCQALDPPLITSPTVLNHVCSLYHLNSPSGSSTLSTSLLAFFFLLFGAGISSVKDNRRRASLYNEYNVNQTDVS